MISSIFFYRFWMISSIFLLNDLISICDYRVLACGFYKIDIFCLCFYWSFFGIQLLYYLLLKENLSQNKFLTTIFPPPPPTHTNHTI